MTTGYICNCCGGRVRVYKRKLNSGMAFTLCWLLKNSPYEYCHIPTACPKIAAQNRDYSQLEFWGLMESKRNTNSAKRDSGIWKLTDLGRQFASNKITVPSHVFVASPNNRFIGFEDKQTTIIEALGNHFNYAELLADL